MMICKVLDNLFDKLYLHEVDTIISNTPINSTNIANRKSFPYGKTGSHRLFGQTLFNRKNINRICKVDSNARIFFDILEMLEDKLNQKFFLNQISLNVQHSGCDGTVHSDSKYEDDITILMMTNAEWIPEWGGQFEIISPDGNEVVEKYEYLPGRIIIFPSNIFHRGISSNNPYVYRTTVVWRVTPLEKYLLTYDNLKKKETITINYK